MVRTAGTASAAVSSPAAGPGRWNPDPESLQFTLAVMPDTQFLYWGGQGSISPDPQVASFRYIIGNGNAAGDNIVFMAHLGDLTEDGQASSFQYVGPVFDILDEHGVAYSVLAGKATGITQLGLPWLLGGYEWAGRPNQVFHGFIGDVRIVNRPLRAGEFMLAR